MTNNSSEIRGRTKSPQPSPKPGIQQFDDVRLQQAKNQQGKQSTLLEKQTMLDLPGLLPDGLPPTSAMPSTNEQLDNVNMARTQITSSADNTAPSAPSNIWLPLHPYLGQLGLFNWPIFISANLAYSSKEVINNVGDALRSTDANYTYSLETFMCKIVEKQTPGQTWVMLVDGDVWGRNKTHLTLSTMSDQRRQGRDVEMQDEQPDHEKISQKDPSDGSESSSPTEPRPSIASCILTVGRELAQRLSKAHLTDTAGDSVPPANLQAIDILVFDYHALAIDVPPKPPTTTIPPTTTTKDIPEHLPLGLDRRPSITQARQNLPPQTSMPLHIEAQYRTTFIASLSYSNTTRDPHNKRAVKVIWDFDEAIRKPPFQGQTAKSENTKGKERAFEYSPNHTISATPHPSHIAIAFGRSTSSERIHQQAAIADFWTRMKLRDEAFEREKEELQTQMRERGVGFELWEERKGKRTREATVEARRRNLKRTWSGSPDGRQ